MYKKKIRSEKIETLEFMLKDKTIRNSLLMEKEVARSIKVMDDGSVVLGRTSCRWWNHFIGDERVITFNEFCIHLIDILSGQKNNKNEVVLNGLKQYFVDGLFDDAVTPEYMIDLLFDCFRHGYNSPYSASEVNFKNGQPRRHANIPVAGSIPIRVNNRNEIIYVPLADISNLML